MLRLVFVFCTWLAAFPAFGQSPSNWQVATITEIRIHQTAEKVGASDVTGYDVSLKVGNTIYVVLYTPPLHQETAKYAAGRDMLVLVGKSTIRYNDLSGQSYEVHIESQRLAPEPKGTKTISGKSQ